VRLAVMTGGVAALLFATKETAPLVLFAVGWAALGAWFTQKDRVPLSSVITGLTYKIILGFLLSFGAVFFLLYSSFGFNLHGLADFAAAQFRFMHRAGGEGHGKPWWTYLAWLFLPHFYAVPWSSWIVAGLAVMGTVLRWRQPLIRLLFFFTLVPAILYSLIPYKTPWLELNLLAPSILLAGVGASSWWNAAGKLRSALVLLAVLALIGLGRETEQICFAHPSDARNPLAYSPTVEDIDRLVARVRQLKASYPHDPANIIQVISTDYWPLPWYLRKVQPVGYYRDVPPAITGDILITSPDLLPALQAKIGPGWKMEYFGLRAEVLAIVLSKPISP
jgi:predicted membrane-bound mannosyltransferase